MVYTDPNQTTPKDMALIAGAVAAMQEANGVCPLSLRIGEKEIRTLGGVQSVRRRRADANLLLTDTTALLRDYDLQVTVEATQYLDFPVYEYLVTIRNVSCKNSPLITDLYASDVVLPGEAPVLYRCNGDFYSHDGYETAAVPLGAETELIRPVGGRPCDQAFPYFRVLCGQTGYNLAVGWPGQWQAEFSAAGGGFRFAAKQQYTAFTLRPGEVYRAPRITVMAYEGGEARGRNLWRRWYLQHILPRTGGAPLAPMMNMCHPAGDEEFTHADEQNQREAISEYLRRGLKPDIWWLDAGWYPCKDAEGIRRWPRTGNWIPDPERFPNGLGPVGEKCAENDIKFLLWFEPERIKLEYRSPELPEKYILYRTERHNGKEQRSDQGLLNLGDPECRAWLTDHVDRLIKEGRIAIYRQDFNFEPLEYWLQADGEDRLGMTENLHVQGYLAYWDALLERNPGLIIDSCASGGRRNDLETMRRSVPLHPTDYGYGMPPVKQAFCSALFTWIPYFRTFTDIWTEENGEYQMYAPDPRGVDSFALHNGLGPAVHCCVFCDASEEKFALVRRFSETVWRPAAKYLLSADYYPLTELRKSAFDWCAYEFHDPKTQSGFVHVIRNARAAADSLTVFPAALDPSRTYRFTDPERGQSFRSGGAAAMSGGLTFELPQRNGALWFFEAVDAE